MNAAKRLVYDLTFNDLQQALSSAGEPAYRAEQVWRGLYCQLYETPSQFTNLPQHLREFLAEEFRFSSLNLVKEVASRDGETQKKAFSLDDGPAIEVVLMRYHDRRTLCISSQAGCAMGCVFCATGQMGYRRNLTSGEIVEQVIHFSRQMIRESDRLTNVVIMGMGEPFHNYEATLAAVDRLNDPKGFNFGARRFTISTVGLAPMIIHFAQEKRQVNLAISLHAADDELRSSLLPINKKYPLSVLMDACREYVTLTKRRLTFEWALIQGINDGTDQAEKLAALLNPFLEEGSAMCHVNLIPLNPTQQYPGLATPRQQAYNFKELLERHGIPSTVRLRRGIEIQAGCGQLATQ